ncbi:MAG: outer membrane beta-barrel protein [Verrucomicrobiae bacterium]|nr:outer membrane beta-barrel protein [Verrucomicrobiae bacterium]
MENARGGIAGQTGHTLAVGLSEQLFPKVTGSVYLGFQELRFSRTGLDREQSTDPFYSIDLTWTPRDKTAVSLSGSSNFQSTASGQANDRRDLRLNVSERLSEKSSLSGGIGYSRNNYKGIQDRKDDALDYNVGYAYQVYAGTSLNLQFNYEDRSSVSDVFAYTRFLASFGATTIW